MDVVGTSWMIDNIWYIWYIWYYATMKEKREQLCNIGTFQGSNYRPIYLGTYNPIQANQSNSRVKVPYVIFLPVGSTA